MKFCMTVNYEEVSFEIPDQDWKEIMDRTEMWSDPDEGVECMDNFRVCRVGNPEQEAMYAQKRGEGCCGSVDIFHMCSSARQYRIGCNYGH
jgi:hypothetical protein